MMKHQSGVFGPAAHCMCQPLLCEICTHLLPTLFKCCYFVVHLFAYSLIITLSQFCFVLFAQTSKVNVVRNLGMFFFEMPWHVAESDESSKIRTLVFPTKLIHFVWQIFLRFKNSSNQNGKRIQFVLKLTATKNGFQQNFQQM